jgi:hypothetical protein
MNLITTANTTANTPGKIRFELHYANDVAGSDASQAHKLLSALSNAYGERETRAGRMIYAELWAS